MQLFKAASGIAPGDESGVLRLLWVGGGNSSLWCDSRQNPSVRQAIKDRAFSHSFRLKTVILDEELEEIGESD